MIGGEKLRENSPGGNGQGGSNLSPIYAQDIGNIGGGRAGDLHAGVRRFESHQCRPS